MIWLPFICIMVVWRKRKMKKWLCEMEMRMKRPQRGKNERKKEMRNERSVRGELRREWDPYGERPKSLLPWKDFEWGVYLGTDAYI